MAPKPASLEEVVEKILDWRVFTDHETGCWIWKPGQWNSGNGYGKIRYQGKAWMAHRLMWFFHNGPIPEKMVLDHKCRRRACCNPEHLELVTIKHNTYIGSAVLFSNTREEPSHD